ncbi:MAG: DUF3426 domain-containing protein [Sulfuritalea sp.]|nr:DUF3426 domain-containing protein [Sulfuritalea sp.]
MLTRCPTCETHFRVTPDQLKARSGRVRCGACQNVFNALDTLIEQQIMAVAPPSTKPLQEGISTPPLDIELDATAYPEAQVDDGAVSPAPSFVMQPDVDEVAPALSIDEYESQETDSNEAPQIDSNEAPETTTPDTETEASEPEIETEPIALATAVSKRSGPEFDERASAFLEAKTEAEIEPDPPAWNETFPEPLPTPRRWPWVILCLLAFCGISLQAALAFRVEMVVLWPETRPALVALCDVAGCNIGLPTRIGLVGIEASDLFPDSGRKGRLALTATLKSRAPFAQQYPHIELTLTDTADRAIARKVLAPAEYLPASTPVSNGMPPNADIAIAIGIEPIEMAASGYRLYLFYP